MNTKEKIIAILQDCYFMLGIDQNKNPNYEQKIALDSIGLINFILKIEEEFNTEIDLNELDFKDLDTLDTFVDFVERIQKHAQ